ncbi:MAG: sulfatase [Planctomycetes bacterium TMED75]|uniref:DUF1501 domain-containing protein n=1 Tax=Candidatus Pelagisphaera phototrophica TaxID=2684113 RepID=UPI000B68DB93|nr:DUF1501 domain-containing protein [Candidatus Pelagisphaera phototrophica]OUU92599.1 MAG: sulfatase [Planctomycetes bacterium TMED75]QXD30946.1 DUF1501 domain-containing protein [Candidatus Pelagisphaera phototrophica]
MTDISKHLRRIKRREFLRQGTLGIGSLALSHLLNRELRASSIQHQEPSHQHPGSRTHHTPKAKNVIFLHMVGGPSQMDTFDPKPELDKWDGRSLPSELTKGQKFAFISPEARAIKSPYSFAPRGKSGIVMSELFPHLANVADELSVIRSMKTNEINHGSGELFLHTGHGRFGRPTFGAWTSYGLGTENSNLPSYVVLKDKPPNSGPAGWGSGFLPSKHQGVLFRTGAKPLFYLDNPEGVTSSERGDVIDAIGVLNNHAFDRYQDPEIQTRIAQYELAYRMQTSVPELAGLDSEPDSILDMYGLDENGQGGDFAKNCLLARRLVERGVRFVQVFNKGWDHHANIYGALPWQAKAVDQSCAGLITDLKQRGLLDETLIIWGGEFGRTPMVQEHNAGTGEMTPPGRDHHKECFSIWMAGGGVKKGFTYGSTDEFGFGVTENEVHVHDFHATCLHLLGIDHERLTYRHQGRDFRLTDVHGHVVHDIIA